MARTREEALENLREVLPHLFIAANMAKMRTPPGGRTCLAIVSKNEDGSGVIGATFEADEFLRDLVVIADDPELTRLFLTPNNPTTPAATT